MLLYCRNQLLLGIVHTRSGCSVVLKRSSVVYRLYLDILQNFQNSVFTADKRTVGRRLRGDIRKIDEQLEAFKARALEAESPVELDAIITQIFTYRDGQCRRLEQLLAGLHGQNAPSLRIKTIRRYDVLPQKRLSSAAEIEAYVEQLKQKLLQELAENDAIQMN